MSPPPPHLQPSAGPALYSAWSMQAALSDSSSPGSILGPQAPERTCPIAQAEQEQQALGLGGRQVGPSERQCGLIQ